MDVLKGTTGELAVALNLIKRGLPVFRNLAPHGVDLVVQIGETFLPVEATCGYWYNKKDGTRRLNYSPHKNGLFAFIGVLDDFGDVHYFLPNGAPYEFI